MDTILVSTIHVNHPHQVTVVKHEPIYNRHHFTSVVQMQKGITSPLHLQAKSPRLGLPVLK